MQNNHILLNFEKLQFSPLSMSSREASIQLTWWHFCELCSDWLSWIILCFSLSQGEVGLPHFSSSLAQTVARSPKPEASSPKPIITRRWKTPFGQIQHWRITRRWNTSSCHRRCTYFIFVTDVADIVRGENFVSCGENLDSEAGERLSLFKAKVKKVKAITSVHYMRCILTMSGNIMLTTSLAFVLAPIAHPTPIGVISLITPGDSWREGITHG